METLIKMIRSRQIGNLLLILSNFSLSLFLCLQIQSRKAFEEISNAVYPNEASLMKSYFLNIFFRKEFAVVIVLLIISMIAKEFWIESFQKKVIINLFLFFFLIFFYILLRLFSIFTYFGNTEFIDVLHIRQWILHDRYSVSFFDAKNIASHL